MRKIISSGALFFCCFLLLTACNTASHEKYFDVAVLNSNLLVGFANDGMARELESPSVKMNEKGQPVAMKRGEVMSSKIQFVEDTFEKLKGLKETEDTKDMLQTSRALYEYVLPVYKTEYVQLARSYDGDAPKEQIHSQLQAIHDKYYQGFNELYTKLIDIGKAYAAKHNIKVNWGTPWGKEFGIRNT